MEILLHFTDLQILLSQQMKYHQNEIAIRLINLGCVNSNLKDICNEVAMVLFTCSNRHDSFYISQFKGHKISHPVFVT